MSNGERTIIAGGLIGGLFLGGFLLKGGITADRTTVSSQAAAAVTPPPAPAAAVDSEVEALKHRIAALEKERLEQRLAELEADTAESDEIITPQADKHEAAPVRQQPAATSRSRQESPPTAARGSSKKTPEGSATLAYWNGLNDIIAREATMRTPPPNVTAANAAGFVESRLQAGRYAAGAIRDLDSTGVDPDAIALGRELTAWYDEEVALNERAGSLLGSGSIAERKGTAGSSWKTGEEQHRRKCDEINRHGAELRTRLSRKYSLAFPPLN